MKNVVKLVLCAILVMGLCITAVGCKSSGEAGQFKVGLECGYPPFNWTQIDDSQKNLPGDMTWKLPSV